jgi:parvulin-like peptidyl-prolyl isomerase
MNSSRLNIFLFLIFAVLLAAIIVLVSRKQNAPVKDAKQLAKEDPTVVASVGPHNIRILSFKQQMLRSGNVFSEKEDVKDFLDQRIDFEVLVVKAKEAGLEKDPEVIRVYRNVLVKRFKEKNLEPLLNDIEISEEEMARYYEKNVSRFTRPAKSLLAIIFMKTGSDMPAEKIQEVKNRLNEARNQALETRGRRGFGSLAIKYSEDPVSQYKGGVIGWVEHKKNPPADDHRLPEKVISRGLSLDEIGDISNIIETDKGLYIIKLADFQPLKVQPFSAVKDKIRQILLTERRKETEKAFIEEMRAATPVTINETVLEKMEIPDSLKEKKEKPAG